MEFLKEILKDKYGEFAKVIEEYNKANKEKPVKLINLTDGGYVSQDKYEALKTEKDNYSDQLTQRDKDLEELKKTNNTEELKNQLGTLQTKYDDDTKKLNDTLSQQRFDNVFELKLRDVKAKNTKEAKTHFET